MITRSIAMGIESEPNLEKNVTLVLEDNGTRDYMTVKDLIEQIESDKQFAEDEGRLEEFLNTEVVMLSTDIEGQQVNSNPQLIVGWCGESFILTGNINSIEFVKEDKQNLDLIREEVINMYNDCGEDYTYNGKRELMQKFYFTFGSGQTHNNVLMEGKCQPIIAINQNVAVEKMRELYGNNWCWVYTLEEWLNIKPSMREEELETITVDIKIIKKEK